MSELDCSSSICDLKFLAEYVGRLLFDRDSMFADLPWCTFLTKVLGPDLPSKSDTHWETNGLFSVYLSLLYLNPLYTCTIKSSSPKNGKKAPDEIPNARFGSP